MEKTLCLTEEEAIGLLDIMLVTPGDLTPEQRSAFMKLSEHCRQLLREDSDSAAYTTHRARVESFRHYSS